MQGEVIFQRTSICTEYSTVPLPDAPITIKVTHFAFHYRWLPPMAPVSAPPNKSLTYCTVVQPQPRPTRSRKILKVDRAYLSTSIGPLVCKPRAAKRKPEKRRVENIRSLPPYQIFSGFFGPGNELLLGPKRDRVLSQQGGSVAGRRHMALLPKSPERTAIVLCSRTGGNYGVRDRWTRLGGEVEGAGGGATNPQASG